MAQTEHLPIYKRTYDLCLYLEQVVRSFPRYQKYTLGTDLRDAARRVLKLVVRAGSRQNKVDVLLELRETLEELKVLLRLGQDAHAFQKFDHAEWSGGRMITQTYVGTRPGGAIAAAWAVMHHLGEAGYLEISRRILEMSRAYVDGINAIPGLRVVGQPHLSIVSYASTDPAVPIAAVADRLRSSGWLIGMTREPPAIVTMLSLLHEPVREEYLGDLRQAVEALRQGTTAPAAQAQASYS